MLTGMTDQTLDETGFLDRIDQRLKALDISASKASTDAGMSEDGIRNLRRRPGRLPRGDNLVKLARALQTTEQWLLTGQGEAAATPVDETSSGAADFVPSPQRDDHRSDVTLAGDVQLFDYTQLPQDVPLYGTAAGALNDDELAFAMSDSPVDYVRRPPGLAKARDVYALRVIRESMLPRFKPGTIVFVDPHRPMQRGDDVIVQTQYREDGPIGTMIAEYLGVKGDKTRLRKYNPESTLEIKTDTILRLHRVLTGNELIGVS